MLRALSISYLLFAVASAQNTINPANYPPIDMIPPTTSPQVMQWLSMVNLTGAPNWPIHQGVPPNCPATVPAGEDWWPCDGIAATDVTNCSQVNTWGLTFDDGPSASTPTLLSYLKSNNLKATFFIVGSRVTENPQLLAQELADGHILACHTWSHHALTAMTNEQIVAEVMWTEQIIYDVTGIRTKYFRPPFGDIDNRARYVLAQLNYTVVDWTGDTWDSGDWQIPSGTMTAQQVITHWTQSMTAYTTATNNTSGFISLQHDLYNQTVAIAPTLIDMGIKAGLTIEPPETCLGDSYPYKMGSNFTTPTNATTMTTTTTGMASGTQSGGTGKATGTSTTMAHSGASTLQGAFFGFAAALLAAVSLF